MGTYLGQIQIEEQGRNIQQNMRSQIILKSNIFNPYSPSSNKQNQKFGLRALMKITDHILLHKDYKIINTLIDKQNKAKYESL